MEVYTVHPIKVEKIYHHCGGGVILYRVPRQPWRVHPIGVGHKIEVSAIHIPVSHNIIFLCIVVHN